MKTEKIGRASRCVLVAGAIVLSGFAAADESSGTGPGPQDLSPYLSAFSVPDTEVMDVWNQQPEHSDGQFAALRLDGKKPLEFFHGAPAEKGRIQAASYPGVSVDLEGYFRHLMDATLAKYEKEQKNGENDIKGIQYELDQFARGEARMTRAEVDAAKAQMADLKDQQQELLKKIVHIENLEKDHPDRIAKEIRDSVTSVKKALATILKNCLWEGTRSDKVTATKTSRYIADVCQGGPAAGMVVALDNVMDRDKRLREMGEPYSLLVAGPLVGRPSAEGPGFYIGHSSPLLKLYGVSNYGCSTDDTKDDTVDQCKIALDPIERKPEEEVAALLERQNKPKAGTVAVDVNDSKSVPVATPVVPAGNGTTTGPVDIDLQGAQ